MDWLVNKGLNPNKADQVGSTPLHWAAKNGSFNTIEVLKAAGADSTIGGIKGWMPNLVATFHH